VHRPARRAPLLPQESASGRESDRLLRRDHVGLGLEVSRSLDGAGASDRVVAGVGSLDVVERSRQRARDGRESAISIDHAAPGGREISRLERSWRGIGRAC
jgi:hypothetical protein